MEQHVVTRHDGTEPAVQPLIRGDLSGADSIVFTVHQAAALLQVSTNHLYSLIAQDAVPHVRLGKLIRIPRSGLLQLIARESGASLLDRDVAIPPLQSVHVARPTEKQEG